MEKKTLDQVLAERAVEDHNKKIEQLANHAQRLDKELTGVNKKLDALKELGELVDKYSKDTDAVDWEMLNALAARIYALHYHSGGIAAANIKQPIIASSCEAVVSKNSAISSILKGIN